MARQGEEAGTGAIDRENAFKNLAQTLNLLLERMEKMKTGNLLSLQLFITALDEELLFDIIYKSVVTSDDDIHMFPNW